MDIVAVLAKVVQQQQTQLSEQRRELDTLKTQLAMGEKGRASIKTFPQRISRRLNE